MPSTQESDAAISGMRGAGTIVAINTDSHAAIFRVAHYCIVEDLTTFIQS